MRVLVYRPQEAAQRTAKNLQDRNFIPIIIPMLHTISLDTSCPGGRFDAIIATSESAFTGVMNSQAIDDLPVFCVGERTSQAARKNGFNQVQCTCRTADELLDFLTRASYRRWLYLAGRDRKSVIEDALRLKGDEIKAWERYAVEPVAAYPDTLHKILEDKTLEAILHYSARSAYLFQSMVHAAGQGLALNGFKHACLSPDIAGMLVTIPTDKIVVARHPDETHLIACLETEKKLQNNDPYRKNQ